MDYFVLCVFVSAAVSALLLKLRQRSQWREALPVIEKELDGPRRHALGVFEHYMAFKPLPEDRQWMQSHGLLVPASRNKWMLSSKGLFLLRKLGYAVY